MLESVLLPRFVLVEQQFPKRAIADISAHAKQQLAHSGIASRVPPGARIAIGVGSRGISNIATITKATVEFWKEAGAKPFIIPVMGSHGAATAEGQTDVLAHYGVHEATMGVPVVSSLQVVSLGKTSEGIEVFLDQTGFESDGIFLLPRVKPHTDFAGRLESGFFKMMAIGLGKFAGAQQYHSFGYKIGLERMIRSVGERVLGTGKVLGGLAIQEGAHHETAGLTVIDAAQGLQAITSQEEGLLNEVKSWSSKLPAPDIDMLIVDELGKNISGAGMDTKVINRSVNGDMNPWPDTPYVRRIFVRAISDGSYGSAIGIGMADVIHDQLVEKIDWTPTIINSLTAGTPACIRMPIHFASDEECLSRFAPTVGKIDPLDVTYCRIVSTLELIHVAVSENLVPYLYPVARVVSKPFEVQWNSAGNLPDFRLMIEPSDAWDFEGASEPQTPGVRG